MSYKKSKLDLILRVRYTNPLPPPPFPPKLLNIPTDPLRYAEPEFTNEIARDTPLPMIVDAECGMPLDLAHWENLWEHAGDDPGLNPPPDFHVQLDPKDEALLLDLPSSSHVNGRSSSSSALASSSTAPPPNVANVTWLRRTEYISRDQMQRASSQQDAKQENVLIDVSRPQQIKDIEEQFEYTRMLDLSTLKHPSKSELTVEGEYELLPDDDLWANAYDLFRFSERPGERPADVDDPRLECAILRPMESEGDHFLAFYLAKEDEGAEEFRRRRYQVLDEDNPPDPVTFAFVRDYETVKVEQEVPNEFLLAFEDGDSPVVDEQGVAKRGLTRPKAAYYKNIERKMTLKKKRVKADEDRWDVIKVSHVLPTKEEEEERRDVQAEVADPMFLTSRAEGDADGEMDEVGLSGGGVGELEPHTLMALETAESPTEKIDVMDES